MTLKQTSVSQCLDKKLHIFGFELPDVLAIFLLLSVLNFVFGQTNLKFFLVWLPSLTLALVLRFGKKGKPDNYLIHYLRFQIKPGILSAFPEPSIWKAPPTLNVKLRQKNKPINTKGIL
ncbi:MAG: hypothetical protein HY843_05310 [Bdellovibrio sp.]|nr:hypothetical protein [Bdellovibrio sp.]